VKVNKGYLIASIVIFVVSIACILGTAYEVIQGTYGLASFNLWGGVLFHGVSAVVASFLLVKAHGQKAGYLKGEQP